MAAAPPPVVTAVGVGLRVAEDALPLCLALYTCPHLHSACLTCPPARQGTQLSAAAGGWPACCCTCGGSRVSVQAKLSSGTCLLLTRPALAAGNASPCCCSCCCWSAPTAAGRGGVGRCRSRCTCEHENARVRVSGGVCGVHGNPTLTHLCECFVRLLVRPGWRRRSVLNANSCCRLRLLATERHALWHSHRRRGAAEPQHQLLSAGVEAHQAGALLPQELVRVGGSH
jgi:hypothetical protein